MQAGASDATPSPQKESTTKVQPGNDATRIDRANPLPFVLARHQSDDCYFDVRLTQVELTYFHGKRLVHQLSFRLDLARPFEESKRIRAAQLTINVVNRNGSASDTDPEILAITPEASLIHIADHEVTTGQTVGVTAGAPPAAGASLSANANLSWGDKTTFKGNRLVHGYIPSSTQAQWKMYEETRSKSGLPPVLYFLVVLRAPGDFVVTADLHIRRWTGWGFLGMRKQVSAGPVGGGYLVRKDPLDEPGQKAFQVSDDLLKLLDESDKKRQVLEDLLKTHFPQLAKVTEALNRMDKTKSISKKTATIVGDARKEVDLKFELWREMAETDEQQDALSMLLNIANRMLGAGAGVEEPIPTRVKLESYEPVRERVRIRERISERPGYDRDDRYDYGEPAEPQRYVEHGSRHNRAVFGKKSQTAEEALAKHQAVSSAWAERKL